LVLLIGRNLLVLPLGPFAAESLAQAADMGWAKT
jgi:hypothetical protein